MIIIDSGKLEGLRINGEAPVSRIAQKIVDRILDSILGQEIAENAANRFYLMGKRRNLKRAINRAQSCEHKMEML
jgi:hypothetical protein